MESIATFSMTWRRFGKSFQGECVFHGCHVFSRACCHMSHAITQVNPEASKLVVSNRRAVLEQEMKELSRGDVVEG